MQAAQSLCLVGESMQGHDLQCCVQARQVAGEQLAASCEAQNSQGHAAPKSSRDCRSTLEEQHMARAPSDESAPQQVSCHELSHEAVTDELRM